jgi:hypothetical protein
MEYRMYCLTERHLSIAQKTIQAAHAIVEYSLKFGDTEEYKHWANYDKTIIVLDGGNTPDMKNDIVKLTDIGHNYEIFMEPDMGNFVTCLAFLVDERVFDYDKYGRNFEEWRNLKILESDRQQSYTDPETGITRINSVYIMPPTYPEWMELIGGEKQEKLKEIISTKRLAQ